MAKMSKINKNLGRGEFQTWGIPQRMSRINTANDPARISVSQELKMLLYLLFLPVDHDSSAYGVGDASELQPVFPFPSPGIRWGSGEGRCQPLTYFEGNAFLFDHSQHIVVVSFSFADGRKTNYNCIIHFLNGFFTLIMKLDSKFVCVISNMHG